MFSSVSQNWPTAEPSFQETGLHCPPDHDRKAVRRLVDLVVQTVQAFGLHRGVLHIEGKCTSRGPRIIEVNARMGGGRIHEIVEAVWGVDLIEAHLRSCLDLPPTVKPSRRPRCAVVDAIVHAPATGRLVALPFADGDADGLPGARDRRRRRGRRGGRRAGRRLRDGAGGGDAHRQGSAARARRWPSRCSATHLRSSPSASADDPAASVRSG